MPGHIRIPGLSDDTLKEKVISFLKEIKGVSNIKSPKWVEFVYNESKFIVGRFYDGEFIVFRKAKSGGMLTNNMRSKSFKDFKERLPKFISLNFRKRTLPYIFHKNDKIEASAEMRKFAYNGDIITASSKQEAIQKIVADSNKINMDEFLKAVEKRDWKYLRKIPYKKWEELDKFLAKKYYDNFETLLKANFKRVKVVKQTKNCRITIYTFDTEDFKDVKLKMYYNAILPKYKEVGEVDFSMDFENGKGWYQGYDYPNKPEKIIKYIKEGFQEYRKEQKEKLEKKLKEKKKPDVKKPISKPKYTNLHTYKSDLYDALTARGLNSEFAMDYVNGLDNDFMKDNQDIKLLVDEAVREWG